MNTNRVVGALLPLVLVAGWFFTLGPVQVGGPAAYVVVDGDSMEPTYSDGDLVVARGQTDYEVGDIVTFVNPDDFGSGMRVIHRIVEIGPRGIATQGDNRDEIDPWPLTESDIIGASVLHVPNVGSYVMTLRTSPLLLGAFVGLVAFVLFLPGRTEEPEPSDASTDEEKVGT